MATSDDTRPDLCPYCGEACEQPAPESASDASLDAAIPSGTPRCRACLAFLDPLSKQVTQGHMGPWYVRDSTRPFYPGVAWDVMVVLIARGEVTRDTVLRGPGSGQFWAKASQVQGVANLLGCCHACGAESTKSDVACRSCGASFAIAHDRDRLGLPGAGPTRRISAFASDDELRGGPPMVRTSNFQQSIAMPAPAPALVNEESLSPLEVTLGQEVATEKRRTRVLFLMVGALLVMDIILATWVLLIRQ